MKDRLINNELDNKLKVLFMPVKENDTFAISVSVNVGPVFESEETKGFSHFLEHSVFNRTEQFKTKNDFNEFCDDHGLVSNAVTFDQLISFYIKGHKSKINEAIYALEQICCFPNFIQQDLEEEKSIVYQEIDYHKNDASSFRWTLALENYFKGYHDALGTKESLSTINTKNLQEFYNHFFKSNNMFITIIGNINIDNALDHLKGTKFNKLVEILDLPQYNKLTRSRNKVHYLSYPTDDDTIMVNYLYKIPPLKMTNQALSNVVSNIIGGLNCSLMNQIIRQENGLAYVVGSTPIDLPDHQAMLLLADVNINALEKTISLIEKVVEEVKNLKDDSMLRRAVENTRTKKILQYESIGNRLQSVNRTYATYGKYLNWKKEERQLDNIKLEDITNFSEKYLKNPFIILISDEKNLEIIKEKKIV